MTKSFKSDDQAPKLLLFYTQNGAAVSSKTQAVPTFNFAQRAESYSTVLVSWLLDCQYLSFSTKLAEWWLEQLSSLTSHLSTGTFATCLKSENSHKYRESSLSAAKHFPFFSLTSLNVVNIVQEPLALNRVIS